MTLGYNQAPRLFFLKIEQGKRFLNRILIYVPILYSDFISFIGITNFVLG